MIAIGERRASRSGVSRREFLRVGSLGLGGLTLPWLLATRAAAAGKSYVRDKSVVLLCLHGGPSQLETWDPKPEAPAETRSMLGVIPTRLAGVHFGSTFPHMAALADRLAIVRSFATGNVQHGDMAVAVAGNKLGAVQGAIYARLAGSIHPRSHVPNHVLLTPASVGYPDKEPQERGPIHLMQTGALATEFQPIKPLLAAAAPSRGKAPERGVPPSAGLLDDMKLNVPPEQFSDRRALLQQLDRLKREIDYRGQLDGVDRFQRQAADVLIHGVASAFDLSREDPATIARYSTDRYSDLKGQNLSVPMALGKQMLLARRLCEAGCGFVSVYSSYWDFHGSAPVLPGIKEGFEVNGPALDHAVAVFLEDVRARGLEDRILLVITGEMGRTPKGQGKGGRDHWGNLTPLVLAGGGVKVGQVIGRSDRIGSEPATNRYGPAHLLATIMQTLFDTQEIRLRRDVPSDLADVVSGGDPIPGLL